MTEITSIADRLRERAIQSWASRADGTIMGMSEAHRIVRSAMSLARPSPLYGFELQGREVKVLGSHWKAVHLDADDLLGLVEVQNDSWGDLDGLNDRGVVEAEVQGIGFLVELEAS